MTVGDLIEGLKRFTLEDQVVVGGVGSDDDWTRAISVRPFAAHLGITAERVARIDFGQTPGADKGSDECSECERLRDVLDDVSRALQDA